MNLPAYNPQCRYIPLADCHLNIVKLLSSNGTILDASTAIASLGYELPQVVGRRLIDLLHPADHDAASGALTEALRNGVAGPRILRCGTIHGAWKTLNVSMLNRLEDPSVRAVIVLTHDVTDKINAESRIAELSADIESVSNTRRAAVQRERRRIARELHDHLGQLLFRLKLSLDMARSSATHELAILHVVEGLEVLQDVFMALRGVTRSMTNPALAKGGLRKALTQLLDGLRSLTRIAIHLDVDPELDLPNPDIALNSFRIVQEAVTNVIHHSKATNLWVTVVRSPGHLAISVIDDGSGFDVAEAIRQGAEGRHSGLLNMKERVALIHGHIDVVSPAGTHGTRITITIPLGIPYDQLVPPNPMFHKL